MGDMRILPMGQSAMLVELDGLDAAMALFAAIEARRTAEIAGPHDGHHIQPGSHHFLSRFLTKTDNTFQNIAFL